MSGKRSDKRSQRAAPGDAPRDPGRRRTLKRLGGLAGLALLDAGALASCGRRRLPARTSRERKLLMLGIDGLDARITRRMMERGELPNLRRLRDMGGFRPLTSTIPPQSPSAWASLVTGRDPGGHGIFDFVHRDPQTYGNVSSGAATAPPEYTLPFGQWRLPLSGSRVESLRQGTAFWDRLAQRGIPCEVHRVPANFPPTDSGARQIAGLGVPDLRGSLGTCSYYSDAPPQSSQRVETHAVRVANDLVRARLTGPRNTLRAGWPMTSVDFTVYLDRRSRVGKVIIQDREIILRQGEWSDWVPVRFVMVPQVKSVTGICRLYLKEVSPHFKLYVSPLQFDPLGPALPIAAPGDFAPKLAERHGRFHTLGIPEDTSALGDGALDDDEYLHQAGLCLQEARRIWESALGELDRGLLFYYFGYTDRNQHVFWRATDPRHPTFDARLGREYGAVVEDCYRLSDELAGEALDACDDDTTLIVVSDHGFAPFYRKFHLNTWLASNGYLAMRDTSAGAAIATRADWRQTLAYGLGLNSLYVNLEGREREGIVSRRQRKSLLRRLVKELHAIRDPETGDAVLSHVAVADEVYSSAQPDLTPDLILGYASGYRCGIPSTIGLITDEEFQDNEGKWSGDHCIDRDAVPGIMLSNRPIRSDHVSLPDITATALAEFDINRPDDVLGQSIL